MVQTNPLALGIILFFIGAALSLLILFTSRALLRRQPQAQATPDWQVPIELPEHSEAVLLIQAGGRIAYTNQQAREWFNLRGQNPSLEHLARRARPGEAFLKLCAQEGQATFTVGERVLEGTSYHIPYGTGQAMLIALRHPRLSIETTGSPDTDGLSARVLEIIAEFNQKMSASPNLKTTLSAVLESIDHLISSDLTEIAIWDTERQQLIPYRLLVDPESKRHLEKISDLNPPLNGYTSYLVTHRKPLLITDVDSTHQANQTNRPQQYPFHSYLGIPLEVGEDLLGTLELAFLSKNCFSENDLEVLRIFSGLATAAVHNALLYEEKQKHTLELTGLAQLAQAISSQYEPEDLYTHLVDSIKPLLDVEILGFLIYNKEQHTLEGKIPFLGLHTDVIEWTHTIIRPGSEAERIWASQETIIASHAPTDPKLQAFNLDHLAQAAGIRHTVLTPLNSSGHMLGYLQVANKRDESSFDQSDLRLLTIISGQAASIIENTALVSQSHQTAQRSETLRRISAGMDIAEIVNRQADRSTVLLTLGGELLTRMDMDTALVVEPSPSGPQLLHSIGTIPQAVSVEALLGQHNPLHHSLQSGENIFVSNLDSHSEWSNTPLLEALESKAFICFSIPTTSGPDSAILAISQVPLSPYSPEDEQLFALLSSQVAVTLQNLHLLTETSQRLAEVNLLLDFSRQLGSLEPTSTLQTLVESATHLTVAQASIALLWEPQQGGLVPQAVSGYPNSSRLMEITYCADEGFFGQVFEKGKLSRLNEVDFAKHYPLSTEDLLRYRDAANGRLPISSMAVPIQRGKQTPILGVLALENFQTPGAFKAEDQAMITSLVQQTALNLENAKLYAETRNLTSDLEQRVDLRTAELAHEHQLTETLLRIITELSASLDLEQVLNRTLEVLKEIVDAEQISVLILRPGEKKLRHLASVGYIDMPHTNEGRVTAFNPGQGLAGWVISKRQPALIPDILEDSRWTQLPDTPTKHRSAIAVPLMSGTEALGAMLLFHREVDHYSRDQLELVQAAANQMAVAVNNAELYRLIRDQAEDLGHMFREQQIETSRSRAILEAVADGVIVTDASRHITLFNAAAEQILGLERSQIIGESLQQFSGLFGRAAKAWMKTIQKWSQDPTTYQTGEIYTERITLENDRVVSIHLSPVSLQDDFLGTVSIFRDITHQVEVDRLKSDFVATVSHELRTPMTSISGYVDILLLGAAGELNEQQSEFLDIVKDNTEQLSILVNDLLDISRIEAGRVTLSLQSLDLNNLGTETVNALIQLSEEDNKAMCVDIEQHPNLPLALGDRERVRQILNNLLNNAYHYTPENGKITLSMHHVEDEVQINVRDNGIGIPPDIQPQVFERFFRGDNPYVLASSGTGLGLSIVQYLVEMHNGRIWVESSGVAGEGTMFSFTLPLYTPENS